MAVDKRVRQGTGKPLAAQSEEGRESVGVIRPRPSSGTKPVTLKQAIQTVMRIFPGTTFWHGPPKARRKKR